MAESIIQHEGLERNKARSWAARYLEEMGLPKEYHERYPHQLSGGQVQRGLLAMAMILDPAVIILDELTSAQDALTKGFVVEIIRKAKDRGKLCSSSRTSWNSPFKMLKPWLFSISVKLWRPCLQMRCSHILFTPTL